MSELPPFREWFEAKYGRKFEPRPPGLIQDYLVLVTNALADYADELRERALPSPPEKYEHVEVRANCRFTWEMG